MRISVSDAKAQLTELVRRAQDGDEIVLTRHGKGAARLVAYEPKPTTAEKRALFARIRAMAKAEPPLPGPDAARSQDFLYDDEDGLPR